jgi:hypothetical protein
MKLFYIFIIMIGFMGCSMGGKNISKDSFNDISVGASVEDLIFAYGKPYNIKTLDNGEYEYEYIERMIIGNRTFEARHYFFIVKDNKVAYKRYDEETPRDKRNSYDLQTTCK